MYLLYKYVTLTDKMDQMQQKRNREKNVTKSCLVFFNNAGFFCFGLKI